MGTNTVAELTTFAAAFSPASSAEEMNLMSAAPARRLMLSSLAEIIVFAGRPAYYSSHNEVPVTLTKERA